jgi:sigma-B regulation protein RsbU (phosphoserine phosphatase)
MIKAIATYIGNRAVGNARRSFAPVLIMLVMFLSSCGHGGNVPEVRKGVIDLRNIDFRENKDIKLSGSWEFFWQKFLVTDGMDPVNSSPDGLIDIPGTWNGYRLHGKRLPDQGFASYRATLLLPPAGEEFAINLLFAISSSRVYAAYPDGSVELLGKAGKPGKTEEDTRPLMGSILAKFRGANRVTLIFEVADFGTNIGGLWTAPSVGRAGDLTRNIMNIRFREFFIIGALTIFGFFHILFFLLRREEKAPLWLGIYCLLVALLSTSYGNLRLFEELYPDANCFEALNRVTFLCIYLGFPIFLTFYYKAFPRYFPARMIYAVWGISVLLTLPVLFLKSYYFYKTLIVYDAHIIIFGLWFVVLMIRGFYQDRSRLAFISFTGLAVIFAVSINDILMVHRVVNTGLYSGYGLFFLVLTQAYIVSSQNASARRRAEKLWKQLMLKSGELESANTMLTDLNLNLEHKVEGRTRELQHAKEKIEAAMEELESVNEHLLSTNSRLEQTQRIIKVDLSMAANVQKSFFVKDPPAIRDWDIAFVNQPMADVSGDFYDFYTEEGRLMGISLFDVSGHGVASGLITMIGKSLAFRLFMENRDKPAADIMGIFNKNLIKEMGAMDNYLTGVMLKIDGDCLEYVNAAHPDLLVRKGGKDTVDIIRKSDHPGTGGFLGIPIMNNEFDMQRVPVQSGDSFLVYSDCLVENQNLGGEPYGLDKLVSAFGAASHGTPAREQLQSILDDFYLYLQGNKRADDLTAVLLRKL